MIVQDIVTRVRRTFGDEAAVQVTDADIIRWINDSQVEIIKHNDSALQQTAYVNLVLGQQEYTMPADLIILRSLRYKFSDMLSYSALRFKNMQQFDDSVDGWDGGLFSQGNPEFFTMYADKAILFPIPSQSVASGLKVLYNQKPTDVVGLSDALALPLIYHNTILKYCMWQASLLDENNDAAMMFQNDFRGDMDMLEKTETSDPVATYHTITVLEFDL
jgi:hypothetical protein